MNYDDLIIKVADSKHDMGLTQELLDYVVNRAEEFTPSQQRYLLELFEEIFLDLIPVLAEQEKNKQMQHKRENFNKDMHEVKKALTVKKPYAEWIAQGKKTIEVRSKNTKHRGELIICSSQKPVIQEMQSGCILCSVDLYDVKPLSKLTVDEWELTKIPVNQRDELKGYGWFLRNPVRMVEYPVKGQLGIWSLVMDKLEFMPYNSATLNNYDVISETLGKNKGKMAVKGFLAIFVIFAIAFYLLSLFVAFVLG